MIVGLRKIIKNELVRQCAAMRKIGQAHFIVCLIRNYSFEGAPTGQTLAQLPHSMHSFASI